MKQKHKELFEEIKFLIKKHVENYELSDQEFDMYYQLCGGHAKVFSILKRMEEVVEVRTKTK